MRRATLLVVLVALGGCATRLWELPDAGDDEDLASSTSAPDAALCTRHDATAVRIASLALVDPPAPFAHRYLRVSVGVALRSGCDVLASVDEQADGRVDTLHLIAWVWRDRRPDAECGAAAIATHVHTVDLAAWSPVIAHVVDGTPGGTARLDAPPPPTCPPARGSALGDPCTSDCDCGGPCLATADGSFACVRSCNEDVDCYLAGDHCSDFDGVPHACPLLANGISTCQGDGDCPYGQRCVTTPTAGLPLGACYVAATSTGDAVACSCDADCGFGDFCAADSTCALPCRTVADCPPFGGWPGCFSGRCGRGKP